MNIELTTSPLPEDAKAISQGIEGFNAARIPGLEAVAAEVRFFLFLRDEERRVVGGVRAICYWNTVHVELLWIAEVHRGNGCGTQLMDKAEEFGIENGCGKAFLETTSWQAKTFYEKRGYRLLGTLADRPKGHSSHFMAKDFGE